MASKPGHISINLPADGTYDWMAIKVDFVRNGLKPEKLIEKYVVSPHTLRRRIRLEGWVEARDEFHNSLKRELDNSSLDLRVAKLEQLNWDDLDVASRLRAQVVFALRASEDAKKPIDPLSLRALAGVAESAQRIARLALGLSTQNTELSGNPAKPLTLTTVDPAKLKTMDMAQLVGMYREAITQTDGSQVLLAALPSP